MTTGNADPSQGENGGANEPPASPPPPAHSLSGGNKVYKSGPLYLSSKGIGWTSWKKRWFILTRTSLVFFRSDPNVVPQKGSEVNLTLGGIDLNSSGSVVVKEDKKLLTVLFPDGRDGRAFTLKAETMEDLHEWKVALEEALANAPVAVAVGQNSILRNDQPNAADISSEQLKDRQSAKSLVIGRPILLALEDIDGTPSFLEKALRFLEEYGVKIEGILRQAADVDDVEHRIREYENGKTEFSAEEDPHVIADCIKYVLRELPSSPVPASCCKALLEAFRTDRGVRVNAMRSAICETFPEPNRRLLQRILMMMQTVASHKAVNRMSISAVAACMAPLLLRPLLAGDCELENDFDVGGDGSVQLLQAAAAANHAQAIVITLLEDYEKIFGEGSGTPEPYTDSEESGSESDEITDDDDYDDGDSFEDDDEATEDDYDVDVDEDSEHEPSATSSETDENEHGQKVSRSCSSGSESPQVHDVLERRQNLTSSEPQSSLLSHDNIQGNDNTRSHSIDNAKKEINASLELLGAEHAEIPIFQEAPKLSPAPEASKSSPGHVRSARRPTVWGRTPAKKNLSMESIDLNFDDEAEIQNLESVKEDLQKRIEAETKTNSLLLDGLQKRKNDLHEHRLALEKDVARLQEQLQKQIELRSLLEGGHRISQMPQSISAIVDEKVKTDLEEITQAEAGVWNLKQKTNNLQLQLNQQHEQNPRIAHDTAGKPLPSPNRHRKSKEKLVDGRVTSTSSTSENVSRSQHEPYLDKTSSGKDKKQESSSLNKSLPPNQQTDAAQNSKDTAVCTSSTTMEMGTNKSSTPGSKKSSSRGEGSNSTSSALSKLTNRLNFLKERRSQIASELQNLDKGHNSSPPVQNLERGGGSEQNMDKSQQPKGQSLEKSRELENSELPNYPNSAGKDRNSEGNPNLDRGKSESFPVAEKGRSKIPPRTFSR